MRINTNLNAMIATNQMTKNTALAGASMEKLSTGLRITKAGDDAAGLAVSEKMRAQIRGMEQAERNVQDGISMVQTAEGALEEAGNIAQRMRELGVQAGNDTLGEEDKNKIKEFIVFVLLSIVGLGVNELCMWLGTDLMGIHYMITKIGATAIVMVYNFVTRKMFIEKKN